MQTALRSVYVRGGTSRALIFHQADLPPATPPHECAAWTSIFLHALGSPDPGGRQLDGLGGGISSLSKIAVVGLASRDDADVDYTFAQVGVTEPTISYRGNCGNISSAIGPFAVDEGLVAVDGDEAVVRIHNTNTGKIIESRFAVVDGRAAVTGDFVISGVAGSGAPIRLAFRDPGGAVTGRLLPTGNAVDTLPLTDGRAIDVSLVDAANPVVFVTAASLALTGSETPAELSDPALLATFEEIRIAGAVAMGIAGETEARETMKNLPLIAIVSAAPDPSRADIEVRAISSGQPHRAVPLTAAMCLAIAAQLPGTLVAQTMRKPIDGRVVVHHASGSLPVAAIVAEEAGALVAKEAMVHRTARRLMDGRVFVP